MQGGRFGSPFLGLGGTGHATHKPLTGSETLEKVPVTGLSFWPFEPREAELLGAAHAACCVTGAGATAGLRSSGDTFAVAGL